MRVILGQAGESVLAGELSTVSLAGVESIASVRVWFDVDGDTDFG